MPTARRGPERRTLDGVVICLLVAVVAAVGCDEPRPRVEVDQLASLDGLWVTEGFLDLGQGDDERWIGQGWHFAEEHARWTARQEAKLTLVLRKGGPARLRMRVMGRRPKPQPTRMTLMINDFVLPSRELGYPLHELVVEVPDGVLRAGDNELTLACDRLDESGGRALGIYLDWIAIETDSNRTRSPAPRDVLTPHHWIEDRIGVLAGGPLELALDSRIDSTATVELCALDARGRVRAILDGATVTAGADTISLAPPADVDPATSCRLRLQTEGDTAQVSITAARRSLPTRDDILLIMIDTLRADFLGCYGHPTAETPRLNRLAEEGVRFVNAVGHSPITGPSHAAFFLSRLPSRAGVVNNFEGELDRGVPTLAELLRAANYDNRATISISPIRSEEGFDRGFHGYEEELGVAFLRDGERTVAVAESLLTRGTTDDPRPRFTFVHLAEPHEPYDAHGTVDVRAEILVDGELIRRVPIADLSPGTFELEVEPGTRGIEVRCDEPVRLRRFGPSWPDSTGSRVRPTPTDAGRTSWELTLETERPGTVRLAYFLSEGDLGVEKIRQRYELEVEAVDDLVGRLLDALDKSGRADRTWVVFTADHGEALGEQGYVGHVQHLYETFVHVPLILRPPAEADLSRGRVRSEVTGGIDLLPTLLDAVGRPVPAGAAGRSLLEPGPRGRRILLETHAPQATHTKYALRGRSTKILWTPETDTYELYDLERDPAERQNLYSEDDPRSQEWKADLDERVRALLAGTERGQALLDPETQAALRSLGYIE